jgi:hypothetical protein
VITGLNREGGRSSFCRFLTATPTHWYALTPNLFPASTLPEGYFIKNKRGRRGG